MKSRNYTNTYSFNGSAALDTRVANGRAASSLQVIQGGSHYANPYIPRQNCRAIQAAQAGLLTSVQILATEVCVLATTALVFAMWVVLH